MKRLTKQFMYGLGHKDCYDACSVCDVAECCDSLEEMLKKLAHYEDLEEQGHRIVNINKIIEQLEENYSCDVGNLKMISVDKVIEVVKGSME